MKKLFHDDASYTCDASKLDRDVRGLIKSTFEKWTLEGFSPRDISNVIFGLTSEIESTVVARLKSIPAFSEFEMAFNNIENQSIDINIEDI